MVQCVTLRDEENGSSAKVLAGFGFNCFSFIAHDEDGDVELLWAEEGFESGERRPSGSGTPLLFPFPGRLPGMEYQWEGKTYQLESDDGRGNGIHGFLHGRPWRVIEQSASRVAGRFQASVDEPDLLERWPADFALECVYELQGNRLDCRLTMENPSGTPLPCGLGSHPYFRLPLGSGAADACEVVLPVRQQWELEDMLPNGRRVDVDPQLRSGAPFSSLQLDNVFTDLEFADGWYCSQLVDVANQRRLDVRFNDAFSECVVYTPPHREAICIEPYTCVPGIGGHADYQHGWKVLAPGEKCSGEVQVELSRL